MVKVLLAACVCVVVCGAARLFCPEAEGNGQLPPPPAAAAGVDDGGRGREKRSPNTGMYEALRRRVKVQRKIQEGLLATSIGGGTPSHVRVHAGDDAFLMCRVHNLGAYAVSWKRLKDDIILVVDDVVFVHDSRLSAIFEEQTETWILKISGAEAQDTGGYRCLVSTHPPLLKEVLLVVVPPDQPLEAPIHPDVDFLLRNISALWEEVNGLRQEVNNHLHHGHTELNHDKILEEVEVLLHEHHVHHKVRPHENHNNHHHKDLLRHLEAAHGHSRDAHQDPNDASEDHEHAHQGHEQDAHDEHGLHALDHHHGHDHAHEHDHSHEHDHAHDDGHDHAHGHDHVHDHDDGHDHGHDHVHDHDDGHDHVHDHDDGHDHGHDHVHYHAHGHTHDDEHDHAHGHDHVHDHDDGHDHAHGHDHVHDHDDGHDHGHDHVHDHDDGHDHGHDHVHDHDDGHDHGHDHVHYHAHGHTHDDEHDHAHNLLDHHHHHHHGHEHDEDSEEVVSEDSRPARPLVGVLRRPGLALIPGRGRTAAVDPWAYASCLLEPNVDDPDSNIGGTIVISQKLSQSSPSVLKDFDGPVYFDMRLTGFDVSKGRVHGFHVHESRVTNGSCVTAGGHFNPHQVTHGGPSSSVRHVGDLGNIEVDEDGQLDYILVDDAVSLVGTNSVISKAIVIHAGEDDLGLGGDSGSLSTGNAGGRLACCNIYIQRDPYFRFKG